MFSAVVSSSA